MKITPTTLTVNQLFSSSNEQFFIPAYQRRYSWEFKQVAELFDDIDLLQTSDSHLLGSIVCLTDSHVVGINTLELVDGQQRITSLSILLKAIQGKYKKLKKKESAEEINALLFCRGIDRKLKNKVLLGDLDNPDYVKLFRGEDVNTIQNQRLKEAYDYFSEWLSEYNNDQLDEFYFKLINNLAVIRLDVGQAKDAYKLFETINNRGLKLSPTDIIKNFLLGHASTFDNDVLQKVKDNWKELIINLDGINTDDFFRQYMASLLKRKVTKSKLIDEFKSYYLNTVEEADKLPEYALYSELEIQDEDEDDIKNELPNDSVADEDPDDTENGQNNGKISITSFSKALRESSFVYSQLLKRRFRSKKVNQHLFNLQRIKSFPTYTFLLNLFQRNLDEKTNVEILKTLETFMLRRHICEYRTGELDDIFSNLVKITDNDIVNQVKKALSRHLPSDDEFELKFTLHNYKGNANRAKYVLEMIEYASIDDKGEYILNTGNEVHLEHIIPQTIRTKKSKREFGNWQKYLGRNALERHKDYVERIGNLTLIAQKLNIIASNNPFKAKAEEYKKSNISITKEVASKFREFRFDEVEKRSGEFAKKARKMWQFK